MDPIRQRRLEIRREMGEAWNGPSGMGSPLQAKRGKAIVAGSEQDGNQKIAAFCETATAAKGRSARSGGVAWSSASLP